MREKPLILAADDDRGNLLVLQRILTASGQYDFMTAETGLGAVEKAVAAKPDLVLLDVIMPGKDGYAACREIKQNPATRYCYVMLVTGQAQNKDMQAGFDSGADDFIPKPYDPAELLVRVRAGLRLKALQDELIAKNTELHELHSQLVQQEKMASVRLLAAGISHEFNNIMTSLYGFAQLARKDDKYKDRLVEVALTDIKRATQITESLLTFSRRAVDVRKDTDLARLMDEILLLVEQEFLQNNITIVREYRLGVAETLVNRGQIQQVFLNLLRNASQAITGKGVITLRMYVFGESVRVEVEDTGAGMSPDTLAKLFEPFYTTKGPLGGSEVPGTGLGLFVTRNIIQKHNGMIDVKSQPGKGTTFTVTLPVRRDRRKLTQEVPTDRRGMAQVKQRRKILVCDDEEPVRNLLVEFLSLHEVVTVNSGEKAVETALADDFDFILLDIKMPGAMDGYAVFDAITAKKPESRVIFITGLLPDAKMESYFSRAYAHIQKPFDLTDVLGLLR